MAKAKIGSFVSDGISLTDFEKLLTGIAFIAVVAAAVIRYATKGTIEPDIVYLTGVVGGLFIGRKIAKYSFEQKKLEIENSCSDGGGKAEE